MLPLKKRVRCQKDIWLQRRVVSRGLQHAGEDVHALADDGRARVSGRNGAPLSCQGTADTPLENAGRRVGRGGAG